MARLFNPCASTVQTNLYFLKYGNMEEEGSRCSKVGNETYCRVADLSSVASCLPMSLNLKKEERANII